MADLVSDRNRVLLLQMDSQIVGQKVEETGRGGDERGGRWRGVVHLMKLLEKKWDHLI